MSKADEMFDELVEANVLTENSNKRIVMKDFDATEYGGAPLLGLKGLVVKSHGSSDALEIRNSILQCITFKKQNINVRIEEALNQSNQ